MAKRGQPSTTVVPGNMLRMRNVGDTAVRGRYRQDWFSIKPNQEAFVEYGLAVTWLGNPLLVDGKKMKERTKEFQRIRMMWLGAEHVHDIVMWPDHRPKLECFTLPGERVYFVADDPTGSSVIDMNADNDTDRLQQQFLNLQASMQLMVGKLQEAGIEVEIPDVNVIPSRQISDSPNRSGTINAPIVLGPETANLTDELDLEEDDFGVPDHVPKDTTTIRKVQAVPVDDAKKIVRVSNTGK